MSICMCIVNIPRLINETPMKSYIIFALSFLFIIAGFIIAITHLLGLHKLIYSFVFFLLGGGLYQLAGFLSKKENP